MNGPGACLYLFDSGLVIYPARRGGVANFPANAGQTRGRGPRACGFSSWPGSAARFVAAVVPFLPCLQGPTFLHPLTGELDRDQADHDLTVRACASARRVGRRPSFVG